MIVNGTVLANGNINVGCNSTLVIGGGSSVVSSDVVRICGTVIIRPGGQLPALTGTCAFVNGGTIVIDVSGLDPASVQNSTSLVLDSSCGVNGNVTTRVGGDHPDRCKEYQALPVVSGPSLSVVVTVVDRQSSECTAGVAGPVGSSDFNLTLALGISFGVIGALAIASVVVVLVVPKFRNKVFPFLQRRQSGN